MNALWKISTAAVRTATIEKKKSAMQKSYSTLSILIATGLSLIIWTCNSEPVAESRFVEPDKLYKIIEDNVRSHSEFEVIVDIDHARLADKADSPMPPAHVLIWSDPEMDAAILKHNPVAALDLPFRILAFENQDNGEAMVIANSFDFLVTRHSLPNDRIIRELYESAISKATLGVPPESFMQFASDRMSERGIVTLDSPYEFAATRERLLKKINEQSDTVIFEEIDFAARAKAQGVFIGPVVMILFGAPGPGGQAMKNAPTLGLDAFCQKLLIWQDASGMVHVTFNDLLALAKRQEVSGGIPLRIINYRIEKTFSEALEQ